MHFSSSLNSIISFFLRIFQIETMKARTISKEEKKTILDRLTWSDQFERFLSVKWPTAKRFGLEGGESSIPGMKALISKSIDLGVESVVMGMPHRGRYVCYICVVQRWFGRTTSYFLVLLLFS
jgi:2-oxoglutarate dehydrogenase complex dehydrogenase (E1) component-like enzyme